MTNPNAVYNAVNPAQIAAAPQKVKGAWYESGLYYGASYPLAVTSVSSAATSGQSVFVPMVVLEDATFDQIAAVVSTAVGGATLQLGVFECTAAGGVGAALFVSGALSAATTGTKSAACSVSLKAGQIVYLAHLVVGTGVGLTSTPLHSLYAIAGSVNAAQTGYANSLVLTGQSTLTTGSASQATLIPAIVRLRRV